MKNKTTTNVLLASAAIAGLLGGTTARIQAAPVSTPNTTISAGIFADTADNDKHSCKGQNSCKGQGGCKAGDNGCKAKNSCKGKGGCGTK